MANYASYNRIAKKRYKYIIKCTIDCRIIDSKSKLFSIGNVFQFSITSLCIGRYYTFVTNLTKGRHFEADIIIIKNTTLKMYKS